ncbi:MAG: hypothetical protein ACI83I_001015 [Bacteroidia bacterium]
MSFELISAYSNWYILLCLLLGAAYSFVLYRKSTLVVESKYAKQWMLGLSTLRFLSATILAILLLNPLLKYLNRTVEKPVVFLAIDNSESMKLSPDSVFLQSTLTKNLEEMKNTLSEKYEVIQFNFGSELNLTNASSFDEPQTNLSAIFSNLDKIYDGKNAYGTIVISDGIYNAGSNPIYTNTGATLPVFSVGVGDTNVRKDIRIRSAKANAITFLNNTYPVEITINADKCSGSRIELSAWQSGVKLAQSSVTISGDQFSHTTNFVLKADKVGTQQIQVRAQVVAGEISTSNNQMMVYTEVIDGRQKILLAAHSPHPDIMALKAALENSDQYEVELKLGSLAPIKKTDYDLVITHGMPVDGNEINWMRTLKEMGVPKLMVLSAQTNVNMLNNLDVGVKISGNRNNVNRSQAKLNPGFGLFELSTEATDYMPKFPPLTTPFGQYSTSAQSQVLSFQLIGSVSTELPLLVFTQEEDLKTGLILGEGFWKWRLFNFEKEGNFTAADEVIRRAVQYLAIKSDKRKFKIQTTSKNYFENEPVGFIAEVYNQSYEFTTKADVSVAVRNEDGKTYNYTLLPNETSYRSSGGALPAGLYTYVSTATNGPDKEVLSGSFVVKALELERFNLTANFGLLKQLSQNSNGKWYYKDQISVLTTDLMSREDATSLSSTSYNLKDVIDQKWIFFLLVFILVLEWFARRWLGGY